MKFLGPPSDYSLNSAARAFLVILLFLAGCGKLFPHQHTVTVSWTASKSHVVGYNVYRISQPNGQRVKLTRSPYTETKYFDTTVEAGHTYVYFVTAVDSYGDESPASDSIIAVVPSP